MLPCVRDCANLRQDFFFLLLLLLLLLVAQVTKSLVSLGGVHEEGRFVVPRTPAKETSENLPVGLLDR